MQKTWLFLFILLFAGTLYADVMPRASADIVTQGKTFLDNKNAWSALEIFASCLQHPLVSSEKQADCLYFGEKSAVAVIRVMSANGCPDDDIARFNRLGLKTRRLHYLEASCDYDHVFYQKLRQEFPDSRYRDEVEFNFRGGCDPYEKGTWHQCEQADLTYIREFPKSEYVVLAKLDLAHLYDDVWRVLTKDSAWDDRASTGDKVADARLAEKCRRNAMSLYRELLESKSRLLQGAMGEIATRYKGISIGIPSDTVYHFGND